jgi:hypothetical protein
MSKGPRYNRLKTSPRPMGARRVVQPRLL